jgi:cytochrome P450
MFPRVQAVAQAATSVVTATAASGDGEVDVADLAKRITTDVMASMLFGQDFGGMTMR